MGNIHQLQTYINQLFVINFVVGGGTVGFAVLKQR